MPRYRPRERGGPRGGRDRGSRAPAPAGRDTHGRRALGGDRAKHPDGRCRRGLPTRRRLSRRRYRVHAHDVAVKRPAPREDDGAVREVQVRPARRRGRYVAAGRATGRRIGAGRAAVRRRGFGSASSDTAAEFFDAIPRGGTDGAPADGDGSPDQRGVARHRDAGVPAGGAFTWRQPREGEGAAQRSVYSSRLDRYVN